jgi:hypothetical protein
LRGLLSLTLPDGDGGILMSFFKRRKEASVKGKLKVKVRSEAVYLFVSLSIALYLVGMSNESDSAYFISRVLLLVPAVSFVFRSDEHKWSCVPSEVR